MAMLGLLHKDPKPEPSATVRPSPSTTSTGTTTPVPKLPESLLTPENCQSPTRIRSFLRLSRFATDDTIREHINGDSIHCDEYYRTKIVPQWVLRSKLIDYCSNYALELHQRTQLTKIQIEHTGSPDSETAFNLRLDPYALKDYNQQIENQFAKSDSIRKWTQNEDQVEAIVRDQTVSILNDKCTYKDWMGEFKQAQRIVKPPSRRDVYTV